MSEMTPMLRQYLGIKEEYPDAILFFRMGDFYEMFFDDARIAARALGITLTARGTHKGEKVPMCGVPHHAAKAYVARLVDGGWKVAICEQLEDPRTAKGVVKRDVVRVVTPGSVVDERDMEQARNVYLAAVADPARGRENRAPDQERGIGLAHLDLSTGDFRFTELPSKAELLGELARIDPAELLLPADSPLRQEEGLPACPVEHLEAEVFEPRRARRLLEEQLEVRSLDGFGCQEMPVGTLAAAALVHYLKRTQKANPAHLRDLVSYRVGDSMFLDQATCTHLELLRTMRRQSVRGSLVHVLDRTVTPMGGRLLRRWIAYPLIRVDDIRRRLAAVAWLREDALTRAEIREHLGEVYDLERLNGRIALGRANARDLLALSGSLQRLPAIRDRLRDSTSQLLSEVAAGLDLLEDVADLIDRTICAEPPVSVREGGMIRAGCDGRLDELMRLCRDGKSWIAEFAASEQKRSGIASLKVGYNRVFGYYIEVSKSNLHLVPPEYVRKQTLVNGERYITEALKVKEEQVLGAEEERIALEFELFERIRAAVARENQRVRQTAARVAEIDVLAALAETAEKNHYACPEVNEDLEIHIVEGRHPVIELAVKEEDFVPNDIHLDAEGQQVLMITGPNMAGKSTVLRQTALTVLMAQMGSFVPASRARIGTVDRIYTRVGASDDLARGQSTFMVEMQETANILRHATPRSLVILDEIGRGTSTYDGLSIAWAVAEALHDLQGLGVRTLFATHYHELTELVVTEPRVRNFNIAVKEWRDRIIFLRKLVPGGTSRSYGIQVARIAGVPERVLKRAQQILENLEGDEPRLARRVVQPAQAGESIQLPLFGQPDNRLLRWIKDLDISSMTPLEALLELNKVKEYVESPK